MKEVSTDLHKEILKFLAIDTSRIYNLEELSKNVITELNTESTERDHIKNLEVFYQSTVLEALILLDDHGLVVLNPETDEFFISNKGLIENSINI